MNLYEKVEALVTGTIFQVGNHNGVPWLKAAPGMVTDLSPIVLNSRAGGADTIPEVWRTYDYRVTVIYTPENDRD